MFPGIRYGRYSLTKVIQDTREVKLRKANDVIAEQEIARATRVGEIMELVNTVAEAAQRHLWPILRENEQFSIDAYTFVQVSHVIRALNTHTHTHTHIYIYIYIEREREREKREREIDR